MERQTKPEAAAQQIKIQHSARPANPDKTLIRGDNHKSADPTSHTRSTTPSNLIGKTINGRYQIDALLGCGGMSDVFKATDLLLKQAGIENTAVAIKILQPQFVNQPEARQLLIQEARKTQQLSHPNIIRVYDYGFDAGQYYMVMEWLDGETLEAVIKRSRPSGLPYKNARVLLNQIAAALNYAHQQGVIHADLKPANIMLTREGNIKVFDFGVAQALHQCHDKYAAVMSSASNPVNGYTPSYASVDVINGKEPKLIDDVYAFSCIAYELASSKHPFDRKPADQAQKQRLHAKKPSNISLLRWWPLLGGLKFSASERCPSIARLQQQLDRQWWPLAVAFGLFIALSWGSIHAYQIKQQQLQLLSEQLQLHNEEETKERALAALPAAQLIKSLADIPEHQQLLINGLLRSKRNELIAFYEHRIDDILNNREGTYPDYYAIESELNAAKSLFPDSNQLARLDVDLMQRWHSTVDVLDERFSGLLEKAQYEQSAEGDDIFQLLAELQTIQRNYRPQPSEKAEQIFAEQFSQALSTHDVTRLSTLIAAGEAAFAASDSLNDLIALGRALKDAVAEVANYQRQTALGNTPAYPYAAAEIFYQKTFDNFEAQLKRANTVAKIDAINRDVGVLAKDLPKNFNALTKIRRALAERYLSFSNSFLQQRKVHSAQQLMEKANKLFALIESAQITL